jgi:hypothetical protein
MKNNSDKGFKICVVGWEPFMIKRLLVPIEAKTTIEFIYCLVGDPSRITVVKKKYPTLKFVALSKTKKELLPEPDYELLASLESMGIPTIKSMIRGDPYIRHRPERESFGYATLLARSIKKTLQELQPDVVLASNDMIHSGISLAVAKSLNIPWVAMAFTSVPDNLTSFCYGLAPDMLVPISSRQVDDELRNTGKAIINNVISGEQKIMAYRAPSSFMNWVKQYSAHGKNLINRITEQSKLGVDLYTAPTLKERAKDIIRRSLNGLALPVRDMLSAPPKGRYIYFPLHMAPESMIDTWAPFYQDQIAFIRQLSIAIPADVELVVKLHFSDPYSYSYFELQRLMRHDHVRIANPFVPSRPFLEGASLVVGITGTSNFEAAVRGIPVLIFGDSPYQHFPRTERAMRPDKVFQQIQRMLDLPSPNYNEIVEAVAVFTARYMPGQVNDWSIPIEKVEFERYANCFLALQEYTKNPDNRENWYKQVPFI